MASSKHVGNFGNGAKEWAPSSFLFLVVWPGADASSLALEQTKLCVERRFETALRHGSCHTCIELWTLPQRHAEVLKQRKEERLQRLLDTAEAAARQRDVCLLYHKINRAAPKIRFS